MGTRTARRSGDTRTGWADPGTAGRASAAVAALVLALPVVAGAKSPRAVGTQPRVAALEERVDALEGQVGTLMGEISQLMGEVSTLQGDLGDALDRIAALETAGAGFGFARANSFETTTSSDWATVPGMSVTLDAEGSAVIRFCAEVASSGGGSGRLKARVDGTDLATGTGLPPGAELQFSLSVAYEDHCFQWVVEGLAAGEHSFDVQWRTFADATSMNSRLLTVEQR